MTQICLNHQPTPYKDMIGDSGTGVRRRKGREGHTGDVGLWDAMQNNSYRGILAVYFLLWRYSVCLIGIGGRNLRCECPTIGQR